MNEPRSVRDLRPGFPVSIDESQVYDYILYEADGSMVGNETGKATDALNAQR